MAGVHLGVAHPPGYPLYTLIVHLFSAPAVRERRVPRAPVERGAGRPRLRHRLLLCEAAARCRPFPPLTAAWLFGVSEPFWSQAIIAEVYTLNALLFFMA